MKHILILTFLSLLIPNAYSDSVATYNSSDGKLHLPFVTISGDKTGVAYNVELQQEAGWSFNVTNVLQSELTPGFRSTHIPETGSLQIPKVIVEGDSSGKSYSVELRAVDGGSFEVNKIHDIAQTPVGNEISRVKWKYNVGSDTYIYYSSAALSRDEKTIYIGTSKKIRSDPSRHDSLIALNSDGSLKWRHELSNGEEVRSSPVIESGKIYFIADYRTGEFEKNYSNLLCLDGNNGNIIFNNRISNNKNMSSTGLSKVIVDNNKVFTVMEYLYVFDANTGEELFKSSYQLQSTDTYVNPIIIDNDLVFILYGQMHLVSMTDYSIKTIDLNHGDVLSTPALDSNTNIYYGTETGEVISIDKEGNLLWKYDFNPTNSFEGPYIRSSIVIDEFFGLAYVGTKNNNESKFLAINISDGSIRWEYPVGRDIYSSPLIGNNSRIYFGSESGYVYALNPDGTLAWKTSVSQDITWASPTIDSNGVIYIGGMGDGNGNGSLYAIQTDSTGLLLGPWSKIHKTNQNTAK